MRLPPMRVIPDDIRSGEAGTVRFRILEEMVETFAELTGDRSALHVSEAFARRSAYRRPVVHGMLPVAFIALIDRFHLKGHRCIPLAISGHFSAPVYIGDRLVLSAGVAELQERKDAIEFNYAVRHEASGTIATRGIVTVAYERERPAARSFNRGSGAPMLPDPPEMQNARLEEIERGQTDAFEFQNQRRNLAGVRRPPGCGSRQAGRLGGGWLAGPVPPAEPAVDSPVLDFRGDLPARGLRDVSGVLGRG